MPPLDRQQAPADPALRAAQLRAARATLAASIPSDTDFEAQLQAEADLQRAQRQSAKDRLEKLDEAVAALNTPPSS